MNAVYSSQEWVTTEPTVLVLKEKVGFSLSSDSGKIYKEDGSEMFKIKGKHITISDAVWLRHPETEENILGMKKKLFSMHATVTLVKPPAAEGGEPEVIAVVKKSKMFQLKAKLNIFIGPSDEGEPKYVVEGGYRAKNIEILDANGDESLLSIGRSQFNVKNILTDQDTYMINLPQGYDAAFWCMICVIIDEIFNDENQS